MNRYAYDESGRRRWVLIAAAVVAIVVLLAVAFVAGRASAPSGGARAQVVNAQGGPGPTRVVNGVPVGYAHTQAGAVAAATNYLMVVDGPLVTQPDKYRAAIDTMAAPDTQSTLRQLATANLTNLQNVIAYAAQGRTIIRRATPLAYKVTSYQGGSAQVSIWGETLLAADGALSLREGWTTTGITCEWTGGDWKLSGIGTAGPESFGPVALSIQAADQSVSLPPQLVEYRSYRVNASG